ncbi:Piso0_001646 [Millerozyma farinosa CBS 7064]|uniref:Piso0_001646 protein n=1 Tax=Pichia sorbitophila (strain ATCC MYA-4447 / BCRC 22081 / CBS 7064 / NBRC 10061 / NRRL Y-12695) TaxID=559304 RepID=G8YLC3_PICSO|nr:Piso0_001646 [Millerozyma farinosa CBS 7064]
MSIFTNKNLIGTPNMMKNSRYQNSLEFTPIGKRQTNNGRSNHGGGNGDRAYNRGLRDDGRESFMESSFDNTVDQLNSTMDFDKMPTVSRNMTNMTNGTHKHMLGGKEIVGNGLSSIKELQGESQKLETENYNLKIKLATLTRFLDQTPEEQRELLSQNVELKQQILQLTREIQTLKDSVRDLNFSNDKENNAESEQIDYIKSNYKKIIQEKDELLSKYEDKIRLMKDELILKNADQHASDDALDKIEKLEFENEKIRHEADTLRDEIRYLENQGMSRKNDLANVMEQDRAKDAKILAMQTEIEQWNTRYDNLKSDYNEAIKSLDKDNGQSKNELLALRSRLRDLEYKYSDAKDNLERRDMSFTQLEEQYSKTRSELNSVKLLVDSLKAQLEDREREKIELRNQLITVQENQSAAINSEEAEYVKQIDELRKREASLLHKNQTLRDDVAEMQDRLYQINVNSSGSDQRLKNSEKQRRELEDKLAYYEKEYELVENALSNAESENKKMVSDKSRLENKIRLLEDDNRMLSSQLRESQQMPAHSALNELENFNRKKLEAEKSSLIDEVYSLKAELQKATRELEIERSSHINHSKVASYQKLVSERDQLSFMLDDSSAKLKKMEAKCVHLKSIIDEKDLNIEEFESRIRTMEKEKAYKYQNEDSEKLQLLKDKANNESKLKLLQLENENIQRELETQANFYKSKIDALLLSKEQESYRNGHSKDRNETDPVISLLEKQLEESQKTKEELNKKLSDTISSNSELKWKVEKLQKDNDQYCDLMNAMEKKEKYVKIENGQLELKVKDLVSDLNRVTRHCKKLAEKVAELKLKGNTELNSSKNQGHDLSSRYDNLQTDNAWLQRKISDLNDKLSGTSLSPSSSNQSLKINLLSNELQYYRAKLYDINMKANDFQIMYQFIMNAVKNSNAFLQNDILKLTHYGVYPDYAEMKLRKLDKGKSLSFKTLATFVLSAVRLRRRTEKSEKRKIKLFELRNEIEKARLSLI